MRYTLKDIEAISAGDLVMLNSNIIRDNVSYQLSHDKIHINSINYSKGLYEIKTPFCCIDKTRVNFRERRSEGEEAFSKVEIDMIKASQDHIKSFYDVNEISSVHINDVDISTYLPYIIDGHFHYLQFSHLDKENVVLKDSNGNEFIDFEYCLFTRLREEFELFKQNHLKKKLDGERVLLSGMTTYDCHLPSYIREKYSLGGCHVHIVLSRSHKMLGFSLIMKEETLELGVYFTPQEIFDKNLNIEKCFDSFINLIDHMYGKRDLFHI